MRFCLALGTSPGEPAPPTDEIGGKARSLRRLADAGLDVPAAFVVSAALFRQLRQGGPVLPAQIRGATELDALAAARDALATAPLPHGFSDQLAAALNRLAGADGAQARWSVRSSYSSEDRHGGLAAGLYHSALDVPTPAVTDALRVVVASALEPAAVLYARRHSVDVDAPGMAVLIHRFVPGTAHGSAAHDPRSNAAPTVDASDGRPLTEAARAALEASVRRLAVEAREAIELEWVATGDAVTYLQLRPFEPATPAPPWPGNAQLGDGDWRWDAAHNPAPLSPAQAGLIDLVDRACQIGARQKVAGGYLLYAPATPPAPAALSVAELLDRIRDDVGQALAALGPTPRLPDALATFTSLYQQIFGALQPAARRARQALADFLQRHGHADPATLAALLDGVPSIATQRRQLADALRAARTPEQHATALSAYLRRFGDETAIWDVAAPTYAERPELLAGSRADPERTTPPSAPAAQLRDRLPPAQRPAFDALLAEARDAVAAGEEDDHLYARVQATVRRALLAEGARLKLAGVLSAAADVFWLPLPQIIDNAPLTAGEAAAQLATARAADAAARRAPPPIAAATAAGDTIVRGHPGAGGRAVGPAFIYPDPGGTLPDRQSIIVATTLLPTELPLLAAAALVVETGGILGHVAAQARERQLPAVVGAVGAHATFTSGDQLLVDGDSGLVCKL